MLAWAAACGAVVWPATSLENIYPTTLPGAARSIRIEAARGEWESVQLCVRTDGDTAESVRVEALGLEEQVPGPVVYLVDYVTLPPSRTRPLGPLRIPDVLRPNTPITVEPHTTRTFWLTYRVPESADPGEWTGNVTVVVGKDTFRIPVSCEVFGFSLPPISSLRSMLALDRASIAHGLGVPGQSLEAWKPVYDALADFRVSYSIWDDPASAPQLDDGGFDAPAMQEHLRYVTQHGTGSAIDVGFGIHGLEPVHRAEAARFIPPTDVYLYAMGHWLRRFDWLPRALVMLPPPPSRDTWQPVRQTGFDIYKAEPGIARLLTAPLHPFFERYVDIWAVPLRDANPYAIARLRDGVSLRGSRSGDTAVVTASGAGPSATGNAYMTTAGDAFDGSFFSHWVSALGPGDAYPWLEVDLERQVVTDEIRIGWVAGHEASEVRVRVSFDGRTFSTASAAWETVPAGDAYAPSWSVGRFTAKKRFVSLRLEFRGQPPDVPVAIADLLLSPAIEKAPAPIEPVQPWLATVSGTSPSLALPGNPAEPRLLPWVCWGRKLLGFVHGGVAHWPEAWPGDPLRFPSDWPTETVLVYPIDGRLAPSIRLMRLRDGMEDYEYFRNLEQMVMIFGARNDEHAVALRRHPLYPADPTHTEIRGLADELLGRRGEIAKRMNELLKTQAK